MIATQIPAHWIVPERVVVLPGTRGASLKDVQLVCGAGPYELDVLVRENDSPTQLEIVGQVTMADHIFEPAKDVPLQLVRASVQAPVADTRTDAFGEFDLTSGRICAYGLRIGDDADAPCVLVWEGEAQ